MYIDIMIVIGTRINIIKFVKKFFNFKFNTKDMNEAYINLGLKLVRMTDEIILA